MSNLSQFLGGSSGPLIGQAVDMHSGMPVLVEQDGMTFLRSGHGIMDADDEYPEAQALHTLAPFTVQAYSFNQFIAVQAAYYDGLWVIVSNTGQIATSTDLISFTLRGKTPITSPRNIAYGNGLWMLTGYSAGNKLYATSPDGVTWTARSGPFTTNYRTRSAYGAGLWIMVDAGTPNKIATSADGINWTVSSQTIGTPQDVAYGSGVWVIAGNSSTINTSPDGVTWTARTSGIAASNDILAISYGNGLWVAVSFGSYISISSDGGVTWTARSGPNVSSITYPKAVYGGGAWAIPTYNSSNNVPTISTSSNAITWSPNVAAGISTQVTTLFVGYGEGGWLAGVFSAGILITSSDGIAWIGHSSTTTNLKFAYGNNQWLGIGGTLEYVWSSPDGITWSVVKSNLANSFSGSIPSYVNYINGVWVALDSNGHNATSTDGITWTARTNLSFGSITGELRSANGLLIFMNGSYQIIGTTDGITWSQQLGIGFTGTPSIAGFGYSNGVWTLITNDGQVSQSTDGVTWIKQSPVGLGTSVSIACAGNGVWIAYPSGTPTALLISPDGVGWTSTVTILNASVFPSKLVYADGLWLAYLSGKFAISTNGITWVPFVQGFIPSTTPFALQYGNGSWLVESSDTPATIATAPVVIGMAAVNDVDTTKYLRIK